MKSLGRKTSLRRTRFRKQTVAKLTATEIGLRASLALAFHDAAQKPWCAACHEPATEPLHAHHLIEANVLRREFKAKVDPLRMAAIQYDARNVIGLCDRCHANHHAGMESPLTSAHVPSSAWEFAKEMDQLLGTEAMTVRLEMYR